jgi:hypothetical protein
LFKSEISLVEEFCSVMGISRQWLAWGLLLTVS